MSLKLHTRLTTVDKGGDYLYIGRHTNLNSLARVPQKTSSTTTARGAGPDRGMIVTLLSADRSPTFRLETHLPEGKSYHAQIEVYMGRVSGELYFRSVENFAERMRVIEEKNPHEHTFTLPEVKTPRIPFQDNAYLTLLEQQYQAERRARFAILCESRYRLGWLMALVEEEVDNAYHNGQHMVDVTIRAVDFYQTEVLLMEGSYDHAPNKHQQRRDIAILIVAGLLHDAGHSGGKKPDNINIDVTISRVRMLRQRLEESTGYAGIVADACEAIRVTEFPFIHNPETLVDKCLRDADVTSFFEPMGSKILFEQIRTEMNLSGKTDNLSLEAFLERQHAFIDDLTLFTEAGLALMTRQKETALQRAKLYVEESLRINSL